jgi:hypothetical protein
MSTNIPKTPTSATGWNPIPKLQTTLKIPLVGSTTFQDNNIFKFISLSGIITFIILFYYIFVKTNTDKKYQTGLTWISIILLVWWVNNASNNLFSNFFMDIFSYGANNNWLRALSFFIIAGLLLLGIYYGLIGKTLEKSEGGFYTLFTVIAVIFGLSVGFFIFNNILFNNGAANYINNQINFTSIIVPFIMLFLFLYAFYYILIGKVYDVKNEVGTMWVYGLFTTLFIVLFMYDLYKTFSNPTATPMPIFSLLKDMLFNGNLIYPIGGLIFLITFVTSLYYAFGGSPSANTNSGANFNPGILFLIILLLSIAGFAYNFFKGRYSEIPENTTMYSLTAFIIILLVPLSLLFYYLFFKPKQGEYETIRRASSPVWWFIFFFVIFIGFICYKIFGGNFTEIMSSAFISQFSGVFYLILYTIFLIVFFNIINRDIELNPSNSIWMNNPFGIAYSGRVIDYVVPITILMSAYFLYSGLKSNLGSTFNITFERIKMMAVLFCFVTILITYYTATPPLNTENTYTKEDNIEAYNTNTNKWVGAKIDGINDDGTYDISYDEGGYDKNVNKDKIRKEGKKKLPENFISKYYGSSLIIVLLLAIFGFLYLVVLLTVPDTSSSSSLPNFLNNFSKYSTASTIGLIIFIVATIIGITKNSAKLGKTKDGVIVATFVTALIWATSILLPNKISGFFENDSQAKANMGPWNKAFLAIFGMASVGCLIFWLSKNIKLLIANSKDKNTIIKFILNLLLVFVILIIIYKTIYVELPYGNAQKNNFFDLIINAIFYIPCILSNIYDMFISNLFADKFTFSRDLNSAKPGTFMLIIALILLIAGIFVYPLFEDKVILQGGELLLNRPINTNKEKVIGKYKNLYIPSKNSEKDTLLKDDDKVIQNNDTINITTLYDYRYAISSWIFLDAMPPSTNKSYQKYTSILSYGGKPDILYNPSLNTILITMKMKLTDATKSNYDILEQSETNYDDDYFRSYSGSGADAKTKDLSIVIASRMENVLLQKWNQFVINCDGGTIDVFCNNELIKSQINMVPYMDSDNLTVGQNDGVYGGICNVVYFNEPLTSDKMYYSYNAVKSSNPPILNDSNTSLRFFEQKKLFS